MMIFRYFSKNAHHLLHIEILALENRTLIRCSILRIDQFRTRGLREDDREHYGQRCSSSAFNADHVTPSRRS